MERSLLCLGAMFGDLETGSSILRAKTSKEPTRACSKLAAGGLFSDNEAAMTENDHQTCMGVDRADLNPKLSADCRTCHLPLLVPACLYATAFRNASLYTHRSMQKGLPFIEENVMSLCGPPSC